MLHLATVLSQLEHQIIASWMSILDYTYVHMSEYNEQMNEVNPTHYFSISYVQIEGMYGRHCGCT